MLRRILGALAGAVLLFTLAPAAKADAPICLEIDPRTGLCTIFGGGGPGGGGGNGGGGNGGGGNGGGTGGGGGGGGGSSSPVIIVNGVECLYSGLADPQPPKSDPVWEGHEDGAIHACTTWPGGGGGGGAIGGGATITIRFWAAGPPAPAPPDPADLARQAIETMGLSAIDIGIVPEDAPGRISVVGMPTWMWAQNPGENTVGPITRTASSGGYTVSATARVTRIVWDMGDGTTVTCDGAGTPYADKYGKSSSPTCGHTYTRQGQYAVTATSYWSVEWAGIGETGVINLDFANTTNITMGEAQVLTR
ncbi:hypothetical protein [Cellulosimicrobium funkei]|uniref:hypothetical protein n=1 Tax=Cellulosimicrobium funkei TaxID=264251 RepID=UPI00342E3F1B